MPNQVIMERGQMGSISYLDWTPHREQNWAKLKSLSSPHFYPLLPPDPYGWGVVLRPSDGGTHLWKKGDGSNGITLIRFLINVITMSRVYFYPKCALESQHWTVWACLQPQRKCELQPNPHISQHNFLLHHHHQEVWFSGRSTRVALTCSM